MIRRLRVFFAKLKSSKNFTYDLDIILSRANPETPLIVQLAWLIELIHWIRYKNQFLDHAEVENVRQPVVRLKFLLNLLDRNPEWKLKTAKSIRNLLVSPRDVDLFASTGLTEDIGFWSELTHRISLKIMPKRPITDGGAQVLSALFPHKDDLAWFSNISPDVMQRLIDLVLYECKAKEAFRPTLNDIEDSLLILSSQIRSIGMTYQIRKRLDSPRVKDHPFFALTYETELFISSLESQNPEKIKEQSKQLRFQLMKCSTVLNQVYKHLDEFGVSIKVVFLIHQAKAKIKRMNDLIGLIPENNVEPEKIIYFISQLIDENLDRQSIKALIDQNLRLISQKIVDRSAEVGELYIAQNRAQYMKLFKKAQGGGAYMSLTVIIKFALSALKLPDFIQGLAYSLNYSLGFVGIQLSGFTLATKQPAVTGPRLASQLSEIEKTGSIDSVVQETVKLIRTQMVGILGNVGLVIPCVLIMNAVVFFLFETNIVMRESSALYLLNSTHIFSFATIYAAFTGVLLWISSVFAGYMDNWFHLNNMTNTISLNRRINYVLGFEKSKKLALFFEKNIASLTANISLAFLLGLVPIIGAFFGLYLDVRHVTLSAGNVALGAAYFGLDVFQMWDLWLSLIGLFFIGIINVGVSFALALWVALKAKSIDPSQKRDILKALGHILLTNPRCLFMPPKE